MKREYKQIIKSRKALVSIVSILLILSFISGTSLTTPLAVTQSDQDATIEQANGLEYQTSSSFPGEGETENVTLDGLMPVNA